jgi:8-oxo-dGTP diphosphatase
MKETSVSLSPIASRSESSGHSGHGGDHGARSGPLLRGRPNLVDRSFQVAYKVAYRLMRAYWAVRRPSTHGALVILWNRGEVLLVQNSYVRYRSLPGGYVARHETGREAAIRELAEEIGITARAEQLEKVFDQVKDWEGKRDHVEIFALELEHRPEIRIDHREVVDATWFTPERALGLDLFPPIRVILEQRLSRTAPNA